MPLSALGKIVTGNTPSKKIDDYWTTHDIPFVKPNDIGEAGVTFLEHGAEYIANEAAKKARLVGSNAVLVTCIGTIAKVAIVDCDRVAFNQQINAICTDESTVNPFYLAYAIKAHENELRALANTAVVPIVNKSQFGSFALGIDPNLRNQNEVVARLRAVEAQQELMKMIIEYLESLVKSRFVEMFGSGDVGYKYPSKPLGELATFKSGASLPKDREQSSGDVIYAKVGDLNLTENSLAIVTSRVFVDAKTAGKHIIPEGAVVFPKRGGAIATNKKRITVQECCLDLNLMSVIPGKKLGTRYLLAWFDSFDLADIANGSAVPQINNKDLNPLQIPLPPLSLQQEFATCVAQVDKLRFAGNHEMNFRCERLTLS